MLPSRYAVFGLGPELQDRDGVEPEKVSPAKSTSHTLPASACKINVFVVGGEFGVVPGVPTVLGEAPPPQPAANIAISNINPNAKSVFPWRVRSWFDIRCALISYWLLVKFRHRCPLLEPYSEDLRHLHPWITSQFDNLI